jgi:hypothetical protein
MEAKRQTCTWKSHGCWDVDFLRSVSRDHIIIEEEDLRALKQDTKWPYQKLRPYILTGEVLILRRPDAIRSCLLQNKWRLAFFKSANLILDDSTQFASICVEMDCSRRQTFLTDERDDLDERFW